MATDSSSSSSDVPPKRFIGRGRRHFFSVILPLILINAGILHILGDQIAVKAGTQITEVKDEQILTTPADDASSENTEQVGIAEDHQPVITTYVVRPGDTLSDIADKFNISINTIRWANDLTSKSTIKPGDEFVILPVTGIEYTVKKGDTLSGIAVKFDANQDEILQYNDIEASSIKVGTELIIPEAEPLPVKAPAKTVAKTPAKTTSAKTVENVPSSSDTKDDDDEKTSTPTKTKFINPIPKGVLTQRIHDGNAVDFGAPIGTPVVAAAGGKVIVAKGSGHNGGYGSYIVINHPDGSQTQYSHLSKVSVAIGDTVSQGEQIGLSGNSGRSTGPHLHYNERNTGKKNTFANLPLH